MGIKGVGMVPAIGLCWRMEFRLTQQLSGLAVFLDSDGESTAMGRRSLVSTAATIVRDELPQLIKLKLNHTVELAFYFSLCIFFLGAFPLSPETTLSIGRNIPEHLVPPVRK